ncbi:hypothetical protein ES703_117703 [subsurface metagenome]
MITYIYQPEGLKIIIADPILAYICLELAGPILNVNENRFPKIPHRHNPACQGEGLGFLTQCIVVKLTETFYHSLDGGISSEA